MTFQNATNQGTSYNSFRGAVCAEISVIILICDETSRLYYLTAIKSSLPFQTSL
jgi:hypothetical protein